MTTSPPDHDSPSAERVAAAPGPGQAGPEQTGPGQTGDDLSAERVGAEIRGTLAVLYRAIRQAKQLGELTMPESSALSRLQQGGPTTAAALARLEQISPQSISVTVASLEAKNLIRRSADPADGRRVILSVTSAGDATVQARRSARDERFMRAVDALTAEERARLRQVLPLLERLVAEL
ncbi:MarR family winged helix-turn-helix transcriptional regulator [Actinacidiphila sp. ITFR-21]|uniref:MarR family winged helix-turn-helix transcriptional regulator n=1 Tax=Actinacidiphila sp. ITFR-21 TaxID=3075199 RepID=UPI00288A462F|nr:MarR family transcriptional regulator [Streptomyces sp. ITFR-21]WNI16018.1 MarR family transcriptional regulator [Streptomyces sp. ITFR-21]